MNIFKKLPEVEIFICSTVRTYLYRPIGRIQTVQDRFSRAYEKKVVIIFLTRYQHVPVGVI